MCGIIGIIRKENSGDQINRAIEHMQHRGPDDRGAWDDGTCYFGHLRLAILDLSPKGHQPMFSHDGRYVIVYNGECYNFHDVRAKLEKFGERFESNGDTEVIIQAYKRWGKDCLTEFNGMFALAIWDQQEKKLFTARDRLGIKPLYYYHDTEKFIFGSEVKGLLATCLISNTLDPEAIVQYFTFGHIQQPRTIVKNVQALMPGHYLYWQAGKITTHAYWKVNPEHTSSLSYTEAKEELLIRIRKAISLQIISDRPLGLFLSGGLDSASVLAAMAHHQAQSHTFSIGFEENPDAKNEEKEARQLAAHFGAKHEQITLDRATVLEDIPKFFRSLDQPSVDGLNTYLVSKYAVRSMTVALSGLGGDELFAGYSRHALLRWKSAHSALQLLSRMMPMTLATGLSGKAGEVAWKSRVYGESDNTLLNYTFARTIAAPGRIKEYLDQQVIGQVELKDTYVNTYRNIYDPGFKKGSLNEILHLDMYGFMSSMLLRDMDPVSMAHSLEVRFPLIDHELVEFAFSLPDDFKLNRNSNKKPGGEGTASYRQSGSKRILMDTMEPFLPAGFADRPKNGFKLPFQFWLKHYKPDQLKALMLDNKTAWSSYLDERSVEQLVNDFVNGKKVGSKFWKVLSFVGSV